MSSSPSTPFPIGPDIPSDLLARIPSLPVKPVPVELTGPRVRLVPLDPARDAPTLYAMSNGEPIQVGERSIGAYDPSTLVWRYLRHGPFTEIAGCEAYLVDLGSAPDILPKIILAKEEWWAANRQKAEERYTAWLLT